jgi:heme/copper-type cytochrome/quinol oxidase subunit 2
MAQVRLRRYETGDGELPDVCMRCGAPADVSRWRTFAWHPQWVYFLLFAGLLPFLIVALVLTKRMRVSVPLCDAHKNHWLTRTVVIWCSFVGLLVLGVGAMVVLDQNRPAGGNDPLGGYLCGGVVVGLIVWLFVAAILQATSIRTVEVTENSVTLTKVDPGFVAALKDQRAGDESAGRGRRRRSEWDDEAEDDDDAPRRRRRRSDDQDD